MKRVVITGRGVVAPNGFNVQELWSNVVNQTTAINLITAFDTANFKVKLAAEIQNFPFDDYFTPRELKFNDRFTQWARIAAKQAMNDSGLKAFDNARVGVILGSGIGGVSSIESATLNLAQKGPSRVSPFFIPMALINLAAGQIAIDYHLEGHCQSVVTACAAGSNAIGEAFMRLQLGYEDIILAGGCEASITPVAIAGFMAMRALHEGEDPIHASIPFDVNRSGFVMGEGAGILVLETLEHALARQATIYGEILGYGSTCDANHITAPLEDGKMAAQAMRQALTMANIEPSDIAYINAHGTSTPLNDATETKAINQVFSHQPPVSSTKSITGHLLGAAGAVEAIIVLSALEHQQIPPNTNLNNPDPQCDLNLPTQPIKAKLKYVMSNSLGFGGHNASLIFGQWED
jgi:3-oxoacyl-[acyl-carrier-protein] synthase II